MKKPIQPDTQDFGLTEDRVEKFKGIFLSSKWFFLIELTLTIVFIFDFKPASISEFTLSILLGGFGGLGPSIISFLLLDWMYKKTQKDYPNFKKYEEAILIYKQEFIIWLKTQLDWWKSLSGSSFEKEVANLFRKQGYKVTMNGGSGDGGVDLVLYKDKKTIIVQCKAHKNSIGPHTIRDLYGTLQHFGSDEAWLITTSSFTIGAQKFVKNKAIKLICISELI